jgi:RNA polymerase sigma-70 factor (ECF subfamily)
MDQGTGESESRSEMTEEPSAGRQSPAPSRHEEDLAVIERASNGDGDAFETLVRKYQTWVFTLAYRMLGDPADAEEMAQEIFLKAFRGLNRFERKSAFSTWLYSIAANHCLNELESRRRRPRPQELNAPAGKGGNPGSLLDQVADPAPGADRVLEGAELQRLVREQLLGLSLEHRSILVLRDIQGLAYEEIGEILSIEPGTVRSRLHRARMELKERLRPYR